MAQDASAKDSTAYINGRVFTVDENNPRVEAFIVDSKGIFTAVGSSKDIEQIAVSQHIPTYNLHQQFVMPGIHDAHVHMLFSGIALTSHARLPEQGLTTLNVVDELKKGSCLCKYAHVQEDWLIGSAYRVEDFRRQALDQAFPTTPVMIRGGAGHSAFFNTAALERSGYDIENEPDDRATRYMRDEHGHLTGEMAEMSLSKAYTNLPQPSLRHTRRVMKEAQYMLHKGGVTSCQEASANTLFLKSISELEAADELKLDVFAHIVYAPDWIGEETSESLHTLLDTAAKYQSTHVNTGFVKIILDGVPLDPYWTQANLEDGKPDESKLFIANIHEAVQKYDERGMTVKVHCTGHGATRITLDAFEAARKRNPNGPKHEVAHCSGVHDDDYVRFRPLNVTAEMSPAFLYSHPLTAMSGGLMDWNFLKMMAANAPLSIGSDWGAGESPDILPHLAGVAEAIGNGDRAVGGEKLCRLLTLAGAEAVGRTKDLGSIQVGKKANFIAVDKDLSKGEFDGANVLRTWFEGEMVYERR